MKVKKRILFKINFKKNLSFLSKYDVPIKISGERLNLHKNKLKKLIDDFKVFL